MYRDVNMSMSDTIRESYSDTNSTSRRLYVIAIMYLHCAIPHKILCLYFQPQHKFKRDIAANSNIKLPFLKQTKQQNKNNFLFLFLGKQ